jgi:hypothetical protein
LLLKLPSFFFAFTQRDSLRTGTTDTINFAFFTCVFGGQGGCHRIGTLANDTPQHDITQTNANQRTCFILLFLIQNGKPIDCSQREMDSQERLMTLPNEPLHKKLHGVPKKEKRFTQATEVQTDTRG